MDKLPTILRRTGAWFQRHRKGMAITAAITLPIILFHLWLSFTNPYAQLNIVEQPYTTTVQNGKISYIKKFGLHVYSGDLAQSIGYYKTTFLILQNTYFGSKPAASSTPDGIIADIHKLRFDPSKPYLISGDQFSVLYPRNLGVFYNSLLNPHTALSQTDWENRERIYLQSTLYALDAFASKKTLTTTIIPIGAQAVALTELHANSVPSDSLYGILYALDAMQDASKYPDAPYMLGTADAAKQITASRRDDLRALLSVYLQQVQDPKTGLAKQGIDIASARDGVIRDRSFYDNVILWKTLQLANKLGIAPTSNTTLDTLRQTILHTYWDKAGGHFKDDLSAHQSPDTNYSSDWLIALPTGFLIPSNPDDQPYLERSVAFIRAQHIADPFPIKYQAASDTKDIPWAVRTFVPNYGGDAIWSYWGAEYMTLLANLYNITGTQNYIDELARDIAIYQQKMVSTHGFPETFTPSGDFLQNAFYKSIRQTGWVVQLESAEYALTQENTTTGK